MEFEDFHEIFVKFVENFKIDPKNKAYQDIMKDVRKIYELINNDHLTEEVVTNHLNAYALGICQGILRYELRLDRLIER
ncbi:MAG: hypothetical protein AABW90_02470 [Nanoarchaeota archaeon]